MARTSVSQSRRVVTLWRRLSGTSAASRRNKSTDFFVEPEQWHRGQPGEKIECDTVLEMRCADRAMEKTPVDSTPRITIT